MPRGVSLHIGLNEVDPAHYRDGAGNPWKGELTACENDARSMRGLAVEQGFDAQLVMLTRDATAAAVMSAISSVAEQLAPGEMLFLTYSGHGGQVVNTNPEDDPEEDALDETWCLYDRQLLDDELFMLFSGFQPGVRILVFSDSCHSGTVARVDPPTADELPAPKQLPLAVAEATERANAGLYAALQSEIPSKRMTRLAAVVTLVSGCQDNEFSRDGTENGAFTGAVLEAWQSPEARRSLHELRKAVAARIPVEYQQNPNLVVYAFDIAPALQI